MYIINFLLHAIPYIDNPVRESSKLPADQSMYTGLSNFRCYAPSPSAFRHSYGSRGDVMEGRPDGMNEVRNGTKGNGEHRPANCVPKLSMKCENVVSALVRPRSACASRQHASGSEWPPNDRAVGF